MRFLDYHLLICLLAASIIIYPAFDSLYGAKINVTLKGKIIKEITGNNTPDYDFFFLPPLENKDFFESIDDLSICRNKYVRKYIYMYLTEGREYLTNAIIRSNRCYDMVENIFDEADDIPKDIALLPLLESAFNPYAISRSKAVGLWQFLKKTSRTLGLKNNKWVDERRNIEKSTTAAIKHLKNLHSIFGSWELTLAAYNGGAAYLKNSMRKTQSKTFSQLLESSILNRETSEYVYRFAALLIIYKNQKLFDIDDETSDSSSLGTEIIELDYPVKLKQVEELTGVSVQTLKNLNPELKQDITPPYEKKYMLKVPESCKEKLENNIAALYAIKYNKLKKHIVKKGECMSRIAAIYKTELKKILLLNNIKSPQLIKPGMELYIPI